MQLSYFLSSFYFLLPAVLSQNQNYEDYNVPSYDALGVNDYSEITSTISPTTASPTTIRRKRIRKTRSPKIFPTTSTVFPPTSRDLTSIPHPTEIIIPLPIYTSAPLLPTLPEINPQTDEKQDVDDKKSDIPWYRCEKPERSRSSSSLDSYFITGYDYCTGECPRFEVICRTKIYEVRKYPETTWAYTTATSYSYNWATRQVTRLHKYFNKENGLETKLSQTSPVLTQIKQHISISSQITSVGKKKDYTILFYIPQAYHWYTPFPRDNKVQIRKIPSQTIFALVPDELKTESIIEKTAERFKAQLQNNKEEFLNEYYYANFDRAGSITQHNEIWVPMSQGATAACERYDKGEFVDYGMTNKIDENYQSTIKNKLNDPSVDISTSQIENKEEKLYEESTTPRTIIPYVNGPSLETIKNTDSKNKNTLTGDIKNENGEKDYDINISGLLSYDHESDTGTVHKVGHDNKLINSIETAHKVEQDNKLINSVETVYKGGQDDKLINSIHTRIFNKPKPTLMPILKPSLKIVKIDRLGEAVPINENDIILEKGVKIIKTSTEKQKNGIEIGSGVKTGMESSNNIGGGKENDFRITANSGNEIKSESGIESGVGGGIHDETVTRIRNEIGINVGKKPNTGTGDESGNLTGVGTGTGNTPGSSTRTGEEIETTNKPGSNTEIVSRPGSGTATLSRPESETGTLSKPESERGTLSRPGSEKETNSKPGSGTGTVSRPGSGTGTLSNPGSETITNSRPGSGTGTVNRPGSEIKIDSRPESGTETGIRSGSGTETGVGIGTNDRIPPDSGKENKITGVSKGDKTGSAPEAGVGSRFGPGIGIGLKTGTVGETDKEAEHSPEELASLLLKLNICSGDKCPTLNVLEFHRLGIQKRTYQNSYFLIISPDTCGYTESIKKGSEMLAEYLNGNNSRNKVIDLSEAVMTILKVSPKSSSEEDCDKKYDVLYYLPEYLQVNPPWPTDPKITLRGIKELSVYSNSILGPITERTIEREKMILEKKLKNLDKCANPNEYFVTTYITPGSDSIKNELWMLVDETCQTASLKEIKTGESLRTYSACSARGVECPWFDQIEIHKTYEGRGYSPAKYWLTTDVKACHIDDARNLGFMRLFQYVMGENEYRSRLVMTAPTILTMRPARANTTGEQCEETFSMSYYLQSNTPPKPLNPRVYLKRIMGDVFVKVFNYTNDDSIRIALNELVMELKQDGRCYDDDEIVLAEYDQPWVPRFQTELWMFRRWCNEAEEFETKRTDYFAIEVDDLEFFDLDYATASKFNITYEIQTDIKKPSANPEACKKTKCAPYEMIKRYPRFEERKYTQDKWVCSRYFGCDIDSVSKRSHTEIFNYFYGEDNIKNELLKNTAPMVTKMDMSEIESDDTSCHHDYVTCSFIPLENQKIIPEPKPESELRIQSLESENFYVLSYGGYTHSERIKELVWQFRKMLDENNLYYKDVAYSAIYDDSRRVWKRHNEIWIPQNEAPLPTLAPPTSTTTGRRKNIVTRRRKPSTTPQTLPDELPEYI